MDQQTYKQEKDIKYKLEEIEFTYKPGLDIYQNSINKLDGSILFIGKEENKKYLYVLSAKSDSKVEVNFEELELTEDDSNWQIKKCPMNHHNAQIIREKFEFTRPCLIGLSNSFGCGDRLGLANPGHIRAVSSTKFKPILAQQSIRELNRTKREPYMVMDAALWAVFQEGYKDGFGSDADHLKTADDIDLMMNAGFTMFTFDPGDHVVNEADTLDKNKLEEICYSIQWKALDTNLNDILNRYENKQFNFNSDFTLTPSKEDVLRAVVKYGKAIVHISKMYKHLSQKHSDRPYEIEISIDETDSVTTPFEHFFMVTELHRLGVEMVSLAPRFIGSFEKGIDYIGDLEIFKIEYLKHISISEHFGDYKISLHSGSDKFSVYEVIGSIGRGFTHVKTAGTSYLEALKVVAAAEPKLFREILDYSKTEFETAKATYHISADSSKVKNSNEYSDEELVGLFSINDARQVLHVTFGNVLTLKDDSGNYKFRDSLLICLNANEELHYKFLYEHFLRHLTPFNK